MRKWSVTLGRDSRSSSTGRYAITVDQSEGFWKEMSDSFVADLRSLDENIDEKSGAADVGIKAASCGSSLGGG
jgi:hypothetical protein